MGEDDDGKSRGEWEPHISVSRWADVAVTYTWKEKVVRASFEPSREEKALWQQASSYVALLDGHP